MKNCIVAQSGGPTVAINASLTGVIDGVLSSNRFSTVYGAINGILGVVNDRLVNLNERFADSDKRDMLMQTPAMHLGSCRFKLPLLPEAAEALLSKAPVSLSDIKLACKEDEGQEVIDDLGIYETIFDTFARYEIGAFFYIGGNDSMDTVDKLSTYAKLIGSDVKIVGVPKTIDNDLAITDHAPGYGSAAKYIATTMLEIAHDTFIYAVKSVTIIEIMGRDAGWLTAAAALARNEYNTAPHLIYLPEVAFDSEKFIRDVKELLTKRDNVIIAVSEGIHDEDGAYITAGVATEDSFGHSQLSGVGKALEYMVREEIGVKCRSVEVNVSQRAASHQASATDLTESRSLGAYAVTRAEEGMTGIVVTMNREDTADYRITFGSAAVDEIANVACMVPREWINEEGNDVNEELLAYMRPLIVGEVHPIYKDGLPQYIAPANIQK